MRNTNLYQLYDLTAEATVGPILPHNRDGAAVRMFHDILADKQTQPGQHPDQFELRFVGIQDEESGQVIGTGHLNHEGVWVKQLPRTIATGKAWLEYVGKDVGDR